MSDVTLKEWRFRQMYEEVFEDLDIKTVAAIAVIRMGDGYSSPSSIEVDGALVWSEETDGFDALDKLAEDKGE